MQTSDTATLQMSSLAPKDAAREYLRLLEEEMASYVNPDTGRLSEELSIDVPECPACGLERGKPEPLFCKDAFSFTQCERCELVYVAPRLNDERTERLYREGRCFYQLEHLYLPTAEYRVAAIYSRKLAELEQRYQKKGTLLDFGCSTGYFLHTAERRGWTGYGVELNPFGVKWAREQLGLTRVYDTPLHECGFEPAQFDVITLWDVLEHIPSPFSILRELRPYLKPRGLLIIETSHYDCFETEVLGKENTNIVGDMHLMHFTRKALTDLLERSGYVVQGVETFGLDLQHILYLDELHGTNEYRIPVNARSAIQRCIDDAGKGCYIKCFATVGEP